MKNTKKLIIINGILLLIALYTFISKYEPDILHFIDSNYVNGEYVSKGGDHFFDDIFLDLFHYLNLLIFYVLNTVYIIKNFIKKDYKYIIVSIISILLMLSIYAWKESINNTQNQIIENTKFLNLKNQNKIYFA